MTDPSIAEIELALGRLNRNQARRALGALAEQRDCERTAVAHVPVLNAIELARTDDQEVTVGVVADRLGLDPSRASRLVTAAIQAGLVTRVASQGDGRRIHLELSGAGRALADQAHEFSRMYLSRVMADWPSEDLAQFARLFTRFIDAMAETPYC